MGSHSVTVVTQPAAFMAKAPLPDVAVAADDGALAREHDVRRAADAVGQRVLAAVEVVELGLRDGVVDVDRREEELAGVRHGVEAVHARCGLFTHALTTLRDSVPEVGILLKLIS